MDPRCAFFEQLAMAFARSTNSIVRHDDVSILNRWRLTERFVITGRRCGAAARPKQLRCKAAGQHRSSPFFLFERNAISDWADLFRRREAALGKRRLGDRWERSYCTQRRRSIRFAKDDRPLEDRRLHKRLPLADHNRPVDISIGCSQESFCPVANSLEQPVALNLAKTAASRN